MIEENKPKIILSLNTKPLISGRWGQGNKLEQTLKMTALSLLYAHLWYDDVELYTDELGYNIFRDFPVKITLLKKERIDELWMYSKIEAMEQQTTPFIHIDTDVFLRKYVDFGDYDVIVERREVKEFYSHYKEQIYWFDKLMDGHKMWNPELVFSLNCGTVGFNNLDIRDDFIKQYYVMEEKFIDNLESFQYLRDKWYEPCIVMEQYNLTSVLDYNRINPKILIDEYDSDKQRLLANKIGYVHLYGGSKYEQKNVNRINSLLDELFPYWDKNLDYKISKYIK